MFDFRTCFIMYKYKKLNNPFNIRVNSNNKWIGKIISNYPFEEFDTLEHGVRAGIILLRNYIRRGYSKPLTIIPRFAPPTENYTSIYLQYISTFLPLDIVIRFPSDEFVVLCVAIARYESNTRLSKRYIYNIINKFQL